jgi:hypothetical protein
MVSSYVYSQFHSRLWYSVDPGADARPRNLSIWLIVPLFIQRQSATIITTVGSFVVMQTQYYVNYYYYYYYYYYFYGKGSDH